MQVWRWDGFFDSLLNTYLLEGAIISVGLTVASLLIGLAIGIALALMRLSGQRVMSGFAVFYCWLFRGTPLLVQLLIIYTGLPLIDMGSTLFCTLPQVAWNLFETQMAAGDPVAAIGEPLAALIDQFDLLDDAARAFRLAAGRDDA